MCIFLCQIVSVLAFSYWVAHPGKQKSIAGVLSNIEPVHIYPQTSAFSQQILDVLKQYFKETMVLWKSILHMDHAGDHPTSYTYDVATT